MRGDEQFVAADGCTCLLQHRMYVCVVLVSGSIVKEASSCSTRLVNTSEPFRLAPNRISQATTMLVQIASRSVLRSRCTSTPRGLRIRSDRIFVSSIQASSAFTTRRVSAAGCLERRASPRQAVLADGRKDQAVAFLAHQHLGTFHLELAWNAYRLIAVVVE